MADERAAMERRKQQAEDVKAARSKVEPAEAEDTTMLDTVLKKLKAGESVKSNRRTKRPERAARPAPPPLFMLSDNGDNAGDLARGMLAALGSDGFGPTAPPITPMSPTKRRPRIKSDPLLAEELANLVNNPDFLRSPPQGIEEEDLEDESEREGYVSPDAV